MATTQTTTTDQKRFSDTEFLTDLNIIGRKLTVSKQRNSQLETENKGLGEKITKLENDVETMKASLEHMYKGCVDTAQWNASMYNWINYSNERIKAIESKLKSTTTSDIEVVVEDMGKHETTFAKAPVTSLDMNTIGETNPFYAHPEDPQWQQWVKCLAARQRLEKALSGETKNGKTWRRFAKKLVAKRNGEKKTRFVQTFERSRVRPPVTKLKDFNINYFGVGNIEFDDAKDQAFARIGYYDENTNVNTEFVFCTKIKLDAKTLSNSKYLTLDINTSPELCSTMKAIDKLIADHKAEMFDGVMSYFRSIYQYKSFISKDNTVKLVLPTEIKVNDESGLMTKQLGIPVIVKENGIPQRQEVIALGDIVMKIDNLFDYEMNLKVQATYIPLDNSGKDRKYTLEFEVVQIEFTRDVAEFSNYSDSDSDSDDDTVIESESDSDDETEKVDLDTQTMMKEIEAIKERIMQDNLVLERLSSKFGTVDTKKATPVEAYKIINVKPTERVFYSCVKCGCMSDAIDNKYTCAKCRYATTTGAKIQSKI